MADLTGVITELLAIRARVDETLEKLRGSISAAAESDVEPEKIYMTVTEYARARGYSQGTITRWANLGMPHIGNGRARRVRVKDADAWIERGGPEKSARKQGMAAS